MEEKPDAEKVSEDGKDNHEDQSGNERPKFPPGSVFILSVTPILDRENVSPKDTAR